MKFGLIGDGYIARRHKKAIEYIKGELSFIYDPMKYKQTESFEIFLVANNNPATDYLIIASPNNTHYDYTKIALKNDIKVIVEKPFCLPWQPLIDDDRINIVLQLRYMDLPKKADLVKAVMVRNEDFWNSWKGNPKLTGGFISEFFIHYIDLAIILGADFEGTVQEYGKQVRYIYSRGENVQKGTYLDIMNIDMQDLYNKMYVDIVNGGGVKPKDIFYLNWVIQKNSEKFGYSKDCLEKTIFIGKELM
ncbi:MAG: hypothetical protein A2163_00785 [Actinobacteria bacterium RBG_13_35_12]|nr:MAG: hypothetical protein A2163_00785 [Actinobacteria bacterium RBG_13_35_12]